MAVSNASRNLESSKIPPPSAPLKVSARRSQRSWCFSCSQPTHIPELAACILDVLIWMFPYFVLKALSSSRIPEDFLDDIQEARSGHDAYPFAHAYKLHKAGASVPLAGTGALVAGIGTPIVDIGALVAGSGTPGMGREHQELAEGRGTGSALRSMGGHSHGAGTRSAGVGAPVAGGVGTPCVGSTATPTRGIVMSIGGTAKRVAGIATPVGGTATPVEGNAMPAGLPAGTAAGGAGECAPATTNMKLQDAEAEDILIANLIWFAAQAARKAVTKAKLKTERREAVRERARKGEEETVEGEVQVLRPSMS
eukprot:TRINITY_DN3596_c0_g1_i4.p1 TRINITY_DN3596_c0_g1~~TRINITY_DN3596_c0_g1_i4.p1  ORF type:complete len:310 (-),score=53.61 TRINITY_DN3596_c0_g1_i4:173-1102(-)